MKNNDYKFRIVKNVNNTFYIKGKTNLYDKSNIMISVKDINGKLKGQSKAQVIKEYFESETCSDQGAGYPSGSYFDEITLSIPSVQPKKNLF